MLIDPTAYIFIQNFEISHLGSIHLRAEIAFQAKISGLEFWPVFQAEISGLIFSGQNFRPKFQARILGRNLKPENSMQKNIMRSLDLPGL